MKHTFSVHTTKKEELIPITTEVTRILREQHYTDGLVHIFVPHTTAAVTINENADPDVPRDILSGLSRIVPTTGFHHCEGNSPAHIKSSLCGAALTIAVEAGTVQLGTWQGMYFCEFDGPRTRSVWLSFLKHT